jgi:hypothetical protein
MSNLSESVRHFKRFQRWNTEIRQTSLIVYLFFDLLLVYCVVVTNIKTRGKSVLVEYNSSKRCSSINVFYPISSYLPVEYFLLPNLAQLLSLQPQYRSTQKTGCTDDSQ